MLSLSKLANHRFWSCHSQFLNRYMVPDILVLVNTKYYSYIMGDTAVYYFTMAGGVWLVILTYTWFVFFTKISKVQRLYSICCLKNPVLIFIRAKKRNCYLIFHIYCDVYLLLFEGKKICHLKN